MNPVKVWAIRRVRGLTNLSLKDAREFVDAIEHSLRPEPQAQVQGLSAVPAPAITRADVWLNAANAVCGGARADSGCVTGARAITAADVVLAAYVDRFEVA